MIWILAALHEPTTKFISNVEQKVFILLLLEKQGDIYM